MKPVRDFVLHALLLAVFIAIAGFLATGVHELVGHGAVCLAGGGSIVEVSVSVSHGFVRCENGSPSLEPLLRAGGILANVVFGAIALLASRRVANARLSLFLLVLTGWNWLGAIFYIAIGLSSHVGDPSAFVDSVGIEAGRKWIPFAILLPIVAALLALRYPAIERKILGRTRPLASVAVLACVGLGLFGYLVSERRHDPIAQQVGSPWRDPTYRAKGMTVIDETQAELAGRPPAEVTREIRARLAALPRPDAPSRKFFTMVLGLLFVAAAGAFVGVIWDRARSPILGAGAAFLRRLRLRPRGS